MTLVEDGKTDFSQGGSVVVSAGTTTVGKRDWASLQIQRGQVEIDSQAAE